MKSLFTALILGTTASVFAQDAPPTPPTPPTPPITARLAIMPAVGGDVIVAGVTKNAPFTADESGETVRLMPDGNRIVQNWIGKMARNSQGRIRREVTSGQVGDARPVIFSGGMAGPGVVALGSGDGVKHIVTTRADAETVAGARTIVAAPAERGSVSVVTTTGHKIEGGAYKGGTWAYADAAAKMAIESGVISVAGAKHVEDGKSQTRKESLGTRDFGGVQAEGNRFINTYAAGAIGNERELEVTSEVWFSKDLGVVVYSKRNDPRSGETTYQMSNIVRAEPDASVFPGNK